MLGEFYRAVLPAQGSYALFDGPRKRHIWCATLDELTQQTEARASKADLYFATASFVSPTERTIDNALYRRAFCFDIDAGPAKVAKHGDKVYATMRDAVAGLVAWCKAAHLQPAWVVSSGAGLHVYFVLDADTSVDEWLPVAKALKAKALAEGLKIDPGPTGDAARILRPVGALHRNGARVAALARSTTTYSLEAFTALVASHMVVERKRERSINDEVLDMPVGPPKTLAKIGARCAAMAHALQARGDVSEPYWRAMLGVIKFTIEGEAAAHAHSEGHPDYDYAATQAKYDRWTAGPATCTTFAEENSQACAGCQYRGKIKSPITLGEMTLADMEAAPPAPPTTHQPPPEPATGTFGGAFDAPEDDDTASLEPQPEPSRPWDKHMPDSFRVVPTADCGFALVQKRVVMRENDAGDEVPVKVDVQFAAVPFWFESWAPGTHDSDQAQAVYCVYDRSRKVTSRYTLPTKHAASRESLLGALAAQNVQVFPSTQQAKAAMEDYVKAALERIRASGQRHKIADRFGTMYNDKGQLVVAQGRHIIDGAGNVFEGVVHERLKSRGSAYGVPLPDGGAGHWGPEVWAAHVLPRAKRHIEYLREFYSDENFLPYQLAIMLAWASPMLAFMQGAYQPGTPLPGSGLTVSLYSPRSGIGKTSAMHAAALAFGVPNAVVLQLDDSNATDNARQGLLLQAGTMPSFMDEMEKIEPKVLAGFVSSVGNGSSKARMNKDLGITGGVTTSLINLMSTNKSHRELVSADRNESEAVQMRLLEIECSGILPVGAERGRQETAARSALHDCAGAVGAVIHLTMCRLGADRLNALGLECAALARDALSGRQDGRFLWRALGAMMAVRRILSNAGLKVFDGPQLVAEFRKWHDAGYEFAAERILPGDGLDLMSMLLSDLAHQTLVTRTETDLRQQARHDIVLNDRMPNEVVARAVLDLGVVYLKTDAVREWAQRRRLSHQGILLKCKQAGVFEPRPGASDKAFHHNVDLFRGTRLAMGVRSSVFRVRLDRLNTDVSYSDHITTGKVVPLRAEPADQPAAPLASNE